MSIDLELSDDQVAIKDLFDTFFQRESPPSLARSTEPLGFDTRLWSSVVELGAPGMGSAVSAGGGGASLADLVIVAEALGRAIAPIPLIEHLAALNVLDEEDLVAGYAIATISLRPTDTDGVWSLVPAGAVADVVVGVDGEELVAVRHAPPMTGPLNHASSPLADRSARTGDRLVLGPAGDFQNVLDRWKVLAAAALVGIADAALKLGVQYVLDRKQFGVPIGSFQAVQHGMADLPVRIDGGRLLTHKAAWAIDLDQAGRLDWQDLDITDGRALASMAFVFASEAACLATERSLHYHGGFGFAEEYDIQLFYRRARGWSLVLDDPANECLELADRLFGTAGGL